VKRGINWEKFLINKYNHLLITLVLLLVLTSTMSVRSQEYDFPFIPLILMIVLIAAMRTNFPRGKFLNIFLVVVVTGFFINLFIYYLPKEYQQLITILSFINESISCFFFALTAYILSRSLFRTHHVSQDTIKGGICAYLMLGFLWAILYSLCERMSPGSFISASSGEIQFVYFSFSTLTTLGYGDIVPVCQAARVLTNIEALTGQVFLAIFVARLVGLYIATEINQKN